MQPILWVAPICIPSVQHGTYGKFTCHETRAQGYLMDFIYLMTSHIAHPWFSTLLLLPTTPNLTLSHWPSVLNLKPRILCGPLGVCFMLVSCTSGVWSAWVFEFRCCAPSRMVCVFEFTSLSCCTLVFQATCFWLRYEVIGALAMDPAYPWIFSILVMTVTHRL